jgi:hypothetical protein
MNPIKSYCDDRYALKACPRESGDGGIPASTFFAATAYPQIVTLGDDAIYQTGINDVVSSIIVL